MPTLKVSVIIPNYNHAPYLEKRIKSVLQQSYPLFELIILDDCSTDNSREIIESYARQDSRIRTLFNEQNSGNTFKQWNKGIKEAKGEYIWLAESDDYADEKFLQVLVKELDTNQESVIAYCQSYHINEFDEIIGSWKTHTDDLDKEKFASDFSMNGYDYTLHYLIYKNTIPNASAVLFRKKAYEEAGGADQTIKVSSDWRLWIKLLQKGNISYICKSLNYYRSHSNTVRTAALKRGLHIIETLQMMLFILDTLYIPDSSKPKLIGATKKIANEWIKSGRLKFSLNDVKIVVSLLQIDRKLGLNVLKRKLYTSLIKTMHTGLTSIKSNRHKRFVSKILNKLIPSRTLPATPHISNFKTYYKLLRGKKGLEIGGPSQIFESKNILPIYPFIGSLDGCNFSTNTIWEGVLKEGASYKYNKGTRVGYQYICEASELSQIASNSYDFILSSHSIEHIANPLKAMEEWGRVLKNKGVLLMVVPHKAGTFDHKRPVTQFDHLLEDYKMNTNEHDLTHLPEILALHDLAMDPLAGNLHLFKERSLNNYENRCLHHHVFDPSLIIHLFSYFNIQIHAMNLVKPFHIIVIGEKQKGKVNNNMFFSKYQTDHPFIS